MSMGRLMKAAPGRPLSAARKAAVRTSPIASGASTSVLYFVIGLNKVTVSRL